MDKIKDAFETRRALVLAPLSMALVVVFGGVASASTTTDPLGGAGDGFFTQLKGYLTDHLIPSVITLAVIGVAVGMLIKWGKKGSKAA
jgi:hypothetical protein